MTVWLPVAGLAGACQYISCLAECPPPSEPVAFRVRANQVVPAAAMPKQAYVFPPLQMNAQLNPAEQHVQVQDKAGRIDWRAPSAGAYVLHAALEEQLTRRGIRPVPFEVLLDQEEDHSVMAISSWYTPVPVAGALGSEGTDSAELLVVRVAGTTFPRSLDPSGKREIFGQEVLVHSPQGVDRVVVIEMALRHAVKHVGRNKELVEVVAVASTSE